VNYEALAPESRLIIPIAAGKQADTSTYAHATTHYKIRKGDTVESVAENFGVSAKMLLSWNRLKGSSLAGRKVLYLHLPVTAAAGNAQVAAKRSTASASHHHAGTETASATSVERTSGNAAAENPVAAGHETVKHHTVKQGETLYSIANSYNTTVSALKHDNRNLAVLRPGMILIVRETR
jgi:membrane-bound lytic murein transglycosylase D